MREASELLIAGPDDADRSVLLLPGGANAARSFDLVMAAPVLSGVRLVATTLPGMAGAPLTDDVSIPGLARTAGELAKEHRCDVVVGFSHGATVALEMLLSGTFRGPVVLLGLSLTTDDDAAFLSARSGCRRRSGGGHWGFLSWLLPLMVRKVKASAQSQEGLV